MQCDKKQNTTLNSLVNFLSFLALVTPSQFIFLRFCWIWTKWHWITSQTRSELVTRNLLFLSLPFLLSTLSYYLSFSNTNTVDNFRKDRKMSASHLGWSVSTKRVALLSEPLCDSSKFWVIPALGDISKQCVGRHLNVGCRICPGIAPPSATFLSLLWVLLPVDHTTWKSTLSVRWIILTSEWGGNGNHSLPGGIMPAKNFVECTFSKLKVKSW